MTSWPKINIASENITNYRVTSPSDHYCQILILAGERPRISFIICCFLFVRQEHVHFNVFLHNSFCIKTLHMLRSLVDLNRRKLLHVYVDISVLTRAKRPSY